MLQLWRARSQSTPMKKEAAANRCILTMVFATPSDYALCNQRTIPPWYLLVSAISLLLGPRIAFGPNSDPSFLTRSQTHLSGSAMRNSASPTLFHQLSNFLIVGSPAILHLLSLARDHSELVACTCLGIREEKPRPRLHPLLSSVANQTSISSKPNSLTAKWRSFATCHGGFSACHHEPSRT